MADPVSLRDALSANIDKMEAEPAPEAAPEPVVEAAPESAETQIPETSPSADSGRARDELGRFKPKDGEEASPEPTPGPAKVEAKGKATGAAPSTAPVAEPAKPVEAAPSVKAPQSWKPAAREAFAKAPPEVQAEVARRESEITRALQETAQAREFAQRVSHTLAPYETIARANGMDAMSFAGNVLQTAAVLQMGAPQQKAQALAQVIKSYGVDVNMLAEALDATPVPQTGQPSYSQPMNIQAEVQRVLSAQMEQMKAQKAEGDVRAFVESKPEFLNDVWGDMQAILAAAGQSQNPTLRSMTLEQAYNRACRMNEDVFSIIQQREAAKAAKTAQAATERARAAASSVRSQPSAAPRAQPPGLREALEQGAKERGII